MEHLTDREKAILVAALRIIMVTVRDESRPFYVNDPRNNAFVDESEVASLLDRLSDTLSPGEAADLASKPGWDGERDQGI